MVAVGTAILEARDVSVTFDDGRAPIHVLSHVWLTLKPGEVVVLHGPPRSGKTTLVSVLGCLLTPTSGRVWLKGEEVAYGDSAALPALRRRHVGVIFQRRDVLGPLGVLENVELALKVRGVPRETTRTEALRILDPLGLRDRAKLLVRDLSPAFQQRVAMARALAGWPTLVLADEPTAGLGEDDGLGILALLRETASRGRAVLIATTDPRARGIADRVVALKDGRVVTTG